MEEKRSTGAETGGKDGRMDRKKEAAIDRRIRIGVILGAVLILAYLAFCAVRKIEIGIVYYILVISFVFLYWLFTDVIALKLKHGFAGRTDAQKSAYYKMAAVDLAGCAGLGMFLVGGVGSASSEGGRGSLIGAVLYLVCLMTARKMRAEYEKDPEEPETGQKDGKAGTDSGKLPTAADRDTRRMTAAERIAALNRQAETAAEPDERETRRGREGAGQGEDRD